MAVLENAPVRKVAFASEGTPIPTLPAPGGSIDWANATAWSVIGNREEGDIASLAEDAIEVPREVEELMDNPPLSQAPRGCYVFKNSPGEISFGVYTYSNDVFALDSMAQATTNAVEFGTDVTYKAMLIERLGLGVQYFPRCKVRISSTSGQIKEMGITSFSVMAFGTDLIPGAQQNVEFA